MQERTELFSLDVPFEESDGVAEDHHAHEHLNCDEHERNILHQGLHCKAIGSFGSIHAAEIIFPYQTLWALGSVKGVILRSERVMK